MPLVAIVLISFNEREKYVEPVIKELESMNLENKKRVVYVAYRMGSSKYENELPEGFNVSYKTNLKTGDIAIFTYDSDDGDARNARCVEVIERKSSNDFLGTEHMHFTEQVNRLEELTKLGVKCTVLLTEPPKSEWLTVSKYRAGISRQIDNQMNIGLKYVNCFGEEHAPYAIRGLVNFWLTGKAKKSDSGSQLGIDAELLGAHGRKKINTPEDVTFVLVNCITGIGGPTAKKLASNFKSPLEMLTALNDEGKNKIFKDVLGGKTKFELFKKCMLGEGKRKLVENESSRDSSQKKKKFKIAIE